MKFNVNNMVKFRGRLGIVEEVKVMKVPDPMKDYILCFVSFGKDEPKEWINESYLVKA